MVACQGILPVRSHDTFDRAAIAVDPSGPELMTRVRDRIEQLTIELHQLDREIQDRLSSVHSRPETETQSFLENLEPLANISAIIADHLDILRAELEAARSNI